MTDEDRREIEEIVRRAFDHQREVSLGGLEDALDIGRKIAATLVIASLLALAVSYAIT